MEKMKTIIRKAGGDFERVHLNEDGNEASKNEDDLWEGELPLVPGRLPEFRVLVTPTEGDDPPISMQVSQVCLEVCGDWYRQVIYVK